MTPACLPAVLHQSAPRRMALFGERFLGSKKGRGKGVQHRCRELPLGLRAGIENTCFRRENPPVVCCREPTTSCVSSPSLYHQPTTYSDVTLGGSSDGDALWTLEPRRCRGTRNLPLLRISHLLSLTRLCPHLGRRSFPKVRDYVVTINNHRTASRAENGTRQELRERHGLWGWGWVLDMRVSRIPWICITRDSIERCMSGR